MHSSSFNDANRVAKELVKLNNTICTRLIRLTTILYYSYSLNVYECLICQICQ